MTPLGLRVVPEVNPMTAGESGSAGSGASIGSASSSSAKWRAWPGRSSPSAPTTNHGVSARSREQGLEGGQVVGLPEAGRGHDGVGLHDVEDVAHLLRTVEVDDRHDDRAELRGTPERDRGLDPVRQLEHHDVAGADAAGPERGGEGPGGPVDLTERAAPRPHLRVHDELGVGQPPDRTGDGAAQRLVGPPALGGVALDQVGWDGPQVPGALAHRARTVRGRAAGRLELTSESKLTRTPRTGTHDDR